MLPYFSSLPLDDTVAIRSSKVLPHRLFLVMVLSASFPFFFFFPMYAWILLEYSKGAEWGFIIVRQARAIVTLKVRFG